MEKRLFGFLFFTRNGLHNIKEIFRKGKIEIGKDRACMLTSVHHWLKAEKQINEIFSEPLVSEWGLGFRLCALEKMGLVLQLYKFNNNDNLTLVLTIPLISECLSTKGIWWFFVLHQKRENCILKWKRDTEHKDVVVQSSIG